MEMTISGLREKLGEANDEQLRELICQLYKQSEVAQQIVDSRFWGMVMDYGSQKKPIKSWNKLFSTSKN